MKWHPTTLRGRVTLWYTALLAAVLALFGGTSAVLLDQALRKDLDASLYSVARAIAQSAQRPSALGPDIEDSLRSMLGPEWAERFFQLLDPFGRLDPRLAPPKRSRLPLSVQALRNAARGQPTLETVPIYPPSPKRFRLLTFPVVSNGSTVNIVQVAMSLENVNAARQGFLLILLILAPVALAGSALGGWFLARRALAPVDAIVDAARRIEAEDLSKRVPALPADDELGRLSTVLNDMLARLERSFGTARRFSADAAHELRTPLTILKGEIEVALSAEPPREQLKQTLASCLEEVNRLNSVVEDLLLMARMESNALSAQPARVNLAEVVHDAAPALTELAARAENHFAMSAAAALWVEGYDALLFRMVFNLAENAIKYTPSGGRIEVRLEQQDGSAVLHIDDDGPGIAPEDQLHIFDPFYRADPSRQGNGTGLGLALVRAIVELHHGRIDLSSELGKGSRFRIILPLAPSVCSC